MLDAFPALPVTAVDKEPRRVRDLAAVHLGGIAQVVLPPHLYPDQAYDKWGNPLLPNCQRL